jgi:hypothetical protein
MGSNDSFENADDERPVLDVLKHFAADQQVKGLWTKIAEKVLDATDLASVRAEFDVNTDIACRAMRVGHQPKG